jgi:hypothetical protein
LRWLAEKPFSEIPGVVDTSQPWILFKALGDNCTSCDEFAGQSVALDNDVQNIGKVLATRAGTTEQSFYELGRPLTDTAKIYSQTVRVLNRPSVTDALFAAETLATNLTRLVVDSGAATSVKTFDFTKAENDSPVLADTGELVNQGYVNSFYFAEDYVGVRQTI